MRTALTLCLLACGAAPAEEIAVGFIDQFETTDNWSANNPRTPPEFSTDGKLLTLADPPGGEVTWGTSIYHQPIEIDLDATPWFVAKVTSMTGGFAVTMINLATNDKRGGLAQTGRPGYAFCQVPQTTGWKGKVRLHFGLYVRGTEKSVTVDWVKFVSDLTPEERAALPARTVLRQPLPHHGLTALSQRNAWRTPARFERNGSGLSERVVYTDTATGNEVWRMTVDPGVDKVAYYDLPEWNADGSRLMFETRRNTERLWVMNSDGTGLRPLFSQATGDRASLGSGYWSLIQPDIWWAGRRDENGSAVIAYDVRTGEQRVVASTQRPGLRLYPPHPKEQYFLLAANAGGRRQDCEVVILGRDGSEQVVPIGGRFHRLRFTKHDNLRIFYNRDDPRTQHVIMPDGSGRTDLPDPGSHPDWMSDGSELTYFANGGVYAVTPTGQRRLLFETGSGGHGGPSRDNRFFIADQYTGGNYPLSIIYARTDGSGVIQQLAHHGSKPMSHALASSAHPDHHSTHPHPSFSPDGTKAVFSSYADRAFTDIHVAVCRYPDPPRNLRVDQRGRRVSLTWEPPEQGRELRGYAILRSDTSGEGYRQVNAELSRETSYTDTLESDAPAYYVVAAVETSGLTSSPATEVCATSDGNWAGPFRRYVEAGSGTWTAPLREWLNESEHSNGYAIGLGKPGEGSLTVPIDVPKPATVAVWVRCKGPGKLAIAPLGELDAPQGWHWLRVGELAVRERLELVVTPAGESVRIDKLLVTDDLEYRPQGRRRLVKPAPAPPRGVVAKALDAFHVELTWDPSPDPAVQYYNVYVVAAPDAYGSQATRVASPGETIFVDWGRRPGSTQHYRVTAVDRFGHESAESAAATVTLPEQQIATIELWARDAELGPNMALVDSGDPAVGLVAAPKPESKGSGTFVTWRVDVPVAGEYAVWSEHRQEGPRPANARVVWDVGGGGRSEPFRMYGTYGRYAWWPVADQQTSTPRRYRLEAGPTAFRLGLGDGADVKLARVLISNDPTRLPTEFAGEPRSALDIPKEGTLIEPRGTELYRETFENPDHWYHEGAGEMTLEEPGTMRIQILGSRQGGPGCQAFCRTDFPDHIALEYDLKVLSPNGLVITFIAMDGLNGEDLITGGLPAREGVFADYVGKNSPLRSYHVSVSRYNDKAEHTGVSNWRRNPGLHMMAQGEDKCREIERWYRIRIVKDGKHLQLQVNGELAHEFTDPDELDTPLPTGGKIGFRAIGSDVRALIRNLRVVALR